MVRTALQLVVDAADTISESMTTAIVKCNESWLFTLGFATEVQNTMETLPFDEPNVFN